MKTIIYFVRHGKVYNPTNILYGRLPGYGLTKEGREQIEQTAKFLAKERIDVLYTSPLLRAKQTADIIKKYLKLPKMKFSKDILEVDTSLQGTSFTYLESINYDAFAGPGKNIKGETIEDILHRMQQFIHTLIKKHAGKKIVVVSHGDPIMIVQASLTKLPMVNESLRPGPEKYIRHGEIYKVECDEYLPLTIRSVFKPTNEN